MGSRVTKGQKLQIRADDYNRMLAAGEAHARGATRPAPATKTASTDILIKNSSGSDIDQFGILGISGPAITPTDNLNEFKARVLLDGAAASDTYKGKFAVAQEPIPIGKIGRARIAGSSIVQISVPDSDDYTHAEIKDADATQLLADKIGSTRIVWVESGTGTKWAVVNISGSPTLPEGGTDGQVLTKQSDDDGDADWEDATVGFTGTLYAIDSIAPGRVNAGAVEIGVLPFPVANGLVQAPGDKEWKQFDPGNNCPDP